MKIPMFQIREITESSSHERWVKDVKEANLPPLTKRPCEVSPVFYPETELNAHLPIEPSHPERATALEQARRCS